jgi:putative ABC transport system permease protein
MSIAGSVRQIVREVDPDQPISNIATMSEVLGDEAAQRRMGMIMLAAFAGLALLLASLGIYGVLAYFVTQHTNEIGVRQALGATPGNILWLVLRKGMGLTFATVPLLLVLVALLACYIPARRATKVDPLVALRYE